MTDVARDSAERVLYTIRDHPWCDVWQLSGLSGVSRRTVYRRLRELRREGQVWTVRVSVPDVRGSLYALGRDGLIHLAGGPRVAESYARAFSLDPMGLGRSLLRVRALSWTRNFLISLLGQGQHLEWATSPARVPVGSRSLVLDAHGCVVPRPGCCITFGVLADTGGIAVEGWGKWMRLFLAWADRQVLKGRERPALVVLTTYPARAAQFVALWRDIEAKRRRGVEAWERRIQERSKKRRETRRRSATSGQDEGDRQQRERRRRQRRLRELRREAQAHLFAAAVDELAAGKTRWRSPDGAGLYLWERVRGRSKPSPRPWSEIEVDQGARGGDLGACMLQGTFGGNAVLLAFRELSRADWKVLDAIASWPLLRSAELAALLGWQRGRTAQSTGRLLEMGVVEAAELVDHEGEKRLHLSPLGIKLLAATHGMHARRFGRARRWPVGQSGPVHLRLGAYEYAVQHTLLTVEFVVGLRRLADWWWEQGYFHQLAIWDSVECMHRYLDSRGRRRFLRPDSGGVYQIGRETYRFLLEIDRDRGHRDRLVSKFRHYYDWRHRPAPLEIGPLPRLLIVCRTEGRARQVNEVLVNLASERDEPILDAAITTLDRIRFSGRFEYDGRVKRIEQEGPGRPVAPSMWPGLREWRLAGEGFDKPTWCFPALAPKERHRALRPLDVTELDRQVEHETRRRRAQRERRRREQTNWAGRNSSPP